MTLPLRVVQAVRPQASPGVIAGAAAVAAVFAATPFLLPSVSERLDVPIGLTGVLSATQVGTFALASFFAGRLFRPGRRLHLAGLFLLAISSFAAAAAPNFPLLVATRVFSGIALGTLTWIGWADATRFPRGIGEVAAVAPLTATLASPPLAWLFEHGGYPLAFAALGVLCLLATVPKVDFGELPRVGRTVSRSRSNRWLLGALFTLSLGGSSVFVFSAAIGAGLLGLSAVTISLALSLNAVSGVAGTRVTAVPRRAGWWMSGSAVAALVMGTVAVPAAFYGSMALWGFAYWVSVPAVYSLLAERSLVPNERVGDAQALMAAGRVFGPLIGGVALGSGHYQRLSVVGAAIMGIACLLVIGVEIARSRQQTLATR